MIPMIGGHIRVRISQRRTNLVNKQMDHFICDMKPAPRHEGEGEGEGEEEWEAVNADDRRTVGRVWPSIQGQHHFIGACLWVVGFG